MPTTNSTAESPTIDVVSPVFNEASSLPRVIADVPRPPVRRIVMLLVCEDN